MINKKEIIFTVIMTIILALAFNIREFSQKTFLYSLLAVFLVLTINTLAKKFTSYYLDSEIEVKPWTIQRFGFKPGWYLKKPFNAGIFFPIITAALSTGYFIWMACLSFDVKSKVYRAAKRFGLYSFSEMTESHIGFIAASGVITNIVVAIMSYFAGWDFFTKLNIYYAFFNMIPISDLDGNKIYFGSLLLWSFLAAVVLIALAYAFLVV